MRSARILMLLAAATVGISTMAQSQELAVGDLAPDFSLKASDGATYELSSFRHDRAVVVAWFPKAFTRGCTVECKSLAENGDRIRQYEVAYFMASVDPVEGAEGNQAFAESMKADFPLLSDPTKATAKAYGVLHEAGYSSRWTFYIDKEGRIAFIDKDVHPATSAEDMVARLEALGVPRTSPEP